MKIETYLKKPNLILPTQFMNEPNEYFIQIDNEEEISKYIDKFDLRYLDGAIIIEWNYKVVLGFDLWDSVNSLWGYIINAVEEYIQVERGGFFFPDQSIRFDLIKISPHYLELKIGEGKYGHFRLPSEEFINALLSEAKHFFGKCKEYFQSNESIFYLKKIDEIRYLIENKF